MTIRDWPTCGHWELELSAYLLKRMEERAFNEIDLRHMLEHASEYHEDILAGRFVIESRHAARRWDVIVEPDEPRRLLVVITAYPLDEAGS